MKNSGECYLPRPSASVDNTALICRILHILRKPNSIIVKYILWSVCVDSDCNKRGQTSRLVVGNEIRTSCHFEASYLIVITLWVLYALFLAMWFWNPSTTFLYGFIGIPLCLIISIFSYTKIFFNLRHYLS